MTTINSPCGCRGFFFKLNTVSSVAEMEPGELIQTFSDKKFQSSKQNKKRNKKNKTEMTCKINFDAYFCVFN